MRRETHAVRESLHRFGDWLDGYGYALPADEMGRGARLILTDSRAHRVPEGCLSSTDVHLRCCTFGGAFDAQGEP